MSMKKAFKSGYKDGKKKRVKMLVKKRNGKLGVKKLTKLGYGVSSEFQSNLTGRKRKGNLGGKTAAVAGLIAGKTKRRAGQIKKGAYKMTAKHKAAISKALKGRKRK